MFKCPNFEKGCKVKLIGENYQISRHMANTCEFRDPNANIVVQGDTWLCCNRKIHGYEMVEGYQHLCNNT